MGVSGVWYATLVGTALSFVIMMYALWRAICAGQPRLLTSCCSSCAVFLFMMLSATSCVRWRVVVGRRLKSNNPKPVKWGKRTRHIKHVSSLLYDCAPAAFMESRLLQLCAKSHNASPTHGSQYNVADSCDKACDGQPRQSEA